MTIKLDLKPETEARLLAYAAVQGVPVDRYLGSLIEHHLATQTPEWKTILTQLGRSSSLSSSEAPVSLALSAQERAERFVNWAKSHTSKAPPLADTAISRESIYRDREDRQR